MKLSLLSPATEVMAAVNHAVESHPVKATNIQECLLGCQLVNSGKEASLYLAALESGDLERLRRMLSTAVMIGTAWGERLEQEVLS